jgi:ribonuclease T1
MKLVITGLLLSATLSTSFVQAKTSAAVDSLATISVAELPVQGAQTYALIAQGGPFPYEKDGTGLWQSRAVAANQQPRLLP